MAEQSGKPSKLYYSMGEVAEMLDVNPSLIRFWEQKFDIIKPKKNKKGNRIFTPADVQNLKMIYHLVKERGMTLSGAQKYIKASRTNIERDMELAEKLQSIRALLLEVRQQLGADGSVIEEEFDEQPSLPSAITEAAVITKIQTTEPTTNLDRESKQEIEKIVEQAHEEVIIDALMDDVLEELNDEPDEILDFDTTPTFESESQEEKPDEPQKPLFIEQTLF